MGNEQGWYREVGLIDLWIWQWFGFWENWKELVDNGNGKILKIPWKKCGHFFTGQNDLNDFSSLKDQGVRQIHDCQKGKVDKILFGDQNLL